MQTEKLPVLIIEDSLQDAELLRQIILKTSYNFAPVLVESSEDALRYLNDVELEKQKRPGLLLLDLYLPGVAGLDFLKMFHQNPRFKDIPVIVLTGSQEREDLVKSYKFGAACFMKKPYNLEEIKEALGQLKITGRF